MTIVVWDGKTLAADKMGTIAGAPYTVTKLVRLKDMLIGISGHLGHGLAMCAWLDSGGNPADFPDAKGPSNDNNSNSGYLLVVHRNGRLERYEGTPHPIIISDSYHVLGSARDFALAALHLGKDAVGAVEVACLLSTECGRGIDTLLFEDDES